MFLRTLLDTLAQKKENKAFCIKDVYYTYHQLYNAVHSIKSQLSEYKNQTSSSRNIAVICSDDFGTYASLLSIWFSDCAYVPLGLHNPVERNISILKDANISIIVSTAKLEDERYANYTVINPLIDRTIDENNLEIEKNIQYSNWAYILFTSGSTGVPKGVPISFKSLDEFIINFERSPFKVAENDRCLQMFELTFDVSISSFLTALIKGACVYTVSNTTIKYVEVLRLLYEYKLTNIQLVPSIIRLAKPLLRKLSFPEVRHCILTGEATSEEILNAWRQVVSNATIYNYYGPTEATIYCSYYKCDANVKTHNGMLAIGSPLGNMKLVIVDTIYKEVGPGEKGELLIAGEQLTDGYINNPVKNKEAFITIPYKGKELTFYRSGDICYKDTEEDIYYCGRLDNQVKVQGFRVELSEIEATVRKGFDVNNVVITTNNKAEAVELILILEKGAVRSIDEVLSFLKTRLPVYMLPNKIIEIDSFPLGSSGKTDKVQLKEMVANECSL